MFATTAIIALLLQVPVIRRWIFSKLEQLAEWHEQGTSDVDADPDVKIRPRD